MQVVSGRWKKVAVGEIEGACLLISTVHDKGSGANFSAECVAPLDRVLEQCCADSVPLGPLVHCEPGQEDARNFLRSAAVIESLWCVIAGVGGRRDGVVTENDIILGSDICDGVVGLLVLPCISLEPVVQFYCSAVKSCRDVLSGEASRGLEASATHDSLLRSMRVPKGEGRFHRRAKRGVSSIGASSAASMASNCSDVTENQRRSARMRSASSVAEDRMNSLTERSVWEAAC